MLAMLSELFLGFLGMFFSENSEQLRVFSEQREKGYEWTYVGQIKPPENTKYFSIKNNLGEEYILFQLKKPNVEKEIVELEE